MESLEGLERFFVGRVVVVIVSGGVFERVFYFGISILGFIFVLVFYVLKRIMVFVRRSC